jgi:hypothetical protein
VYKIHSYVDATILFKMNPTILYLGYDIRLIRFFPVANRCLGGNNLHCFFLQKTQILQVNDLQTALHVFVKKDDNMAFHSCLQKNTEDAKVRDTSHHQYLRIVESDPGGLYPCYIYYQIVL